MALTGAPDRVPVRTKVVFALGSSAEMVEAAPSPDEVIVSTPS